MTAVSLHLTIDQLGQLRDILTSYTDEGPFESGWASKKLVTLRSAVSHALNNANSGADNCELENFILLNQEEQSIVRLLQDAWCIFRGLRKTQPEEARQFTDALQSAHNIVAARPVAMLHRD